MNFDFFENMKGHAKRLFGIEATDMTEQELDASLAGIDSEPLEDLRNKLNKTNEALEESNKTIDDQKSKMAEMGEAFNADIEALKEDFQEKLNNAVSELSTKLNNGFTDKLKEIEAKNKKTVDNLTSKLEEANNNINDIADSVNKMKGNPSSGTTSTPQPVAGEEIKDEKTNEVKIKKGGQLSAFLKGVKVVDN